ncbi:MAG TPA: hypothetical protein VGD56_00810 [Gemmatirosa sp.]
MTEITIAPTAERSAAHGETPDVEAGGDVRAAGRDGPGRDAQRRGMDPLFGVRTADIEPYTGLRYLSKLFRMIAVVLVLLLIAEVVTGLITQGTDSITTLLAEVSRLIVLAGALWGVGDLAILLIDVGHDVRAARILIGRQTAHLAHHPHEGQVAGPAASAPPTMPIAVPVREPRITPRT